jgi:membrane protein
MEFRKVGSMVKQVYQDIIDNHTMAMAAGLSYYFVMSFFPLLILAAAIVSYLPIPNLFDTILGALQSVIPADSMGLVRGILRDVISPNKGSFLTIGILGTLWTASNGFAALIEALDVAYEVPETRPFYMTRSLAIGMMLAVGTLLVIGATLIFVGPQFGAWLAAKAHVSDAFAFAWPYLRWIFAIAFAVLAVELVFFWGPNVKQRFWATLPGAAIGVGFWLVTSWALGLYFQNFAHFNRTYGTLGAAVALMVWLYWSWFVVLIGAEFNSELLKASGQGRLVIKHPPPPVIHRRPAWEEAEEEEKREGERAA